MTGMDRAEPAPVWRIWLAGLWVLLAISGGGFDRPHNPFSVPLLMESMIALSGAAMIYLILRRGADHVIWAMAAIPVAMMVYSAVAAGVRFGQPFAYGMLEERRMLLLWAIAPLALLNLPAMEMARAVLWALLAVVLLGVLHRAGVVPGWKTYQISDFRAARANFSAPFVMVAGLLALAIWGYAPLRRVWLVGLPIAALFFLAFVAQTRQVIAAAVIIGIGVFVIAPMRPAARLMGAAAGLMIAAIGCAALSWGMVPGVDLGLSDIGQSVRADTVRIIGDTASWAGNGALSLQWQGGFHALYGPHFYLSDVGIMGSVYRFGAASLIVIAATLWMLAQLLRPVETAVRPIGVGVLAGAAALLLLWPLGAILEGRAEIVALLLALHRSARDDAA